MVDPCLLLIVIRNPIRVSTLYQGLLLMVRLIGLHASWRILTVLVRVCVLDLIDGLLLRFHVYETLCRVLTLLWVLWAISTFLYQLSICLDRMVY